MPKQQDSNTLSLPQLLQLAGIGGPPQQDSTREALSYMQGQQRLLAEEADRKVKQQQADQEHEYRMKALEHQDSSLMQAEKTARVHALTAILNGMLPTNPLYAVYSKAIQNELGIESPQAPTEKTHVGDLTTPASTASTIMSNDPSVANRIGSLGKQVPRTILPVPTVDGGYAPSLLDQLITQGIVGNVKNFSRGLVGLPSTPTATFSQVGDYLGNMLGDSVFSQSVPADNRTAPADLSGLTGTLDSSLPPNLLDNLSPEQKQRLMQAVPQFQPQQLKF